MTSSSVSFDLAQLLHEVCREFNLDSYTVGYLKSRFKNEGVKFLTVTLPKVSKEVIKGLEFGFFDRSRLTDFAWKRRSLRVFRSLLSGIFCEDTGLVQPTPDPFCIWAIRQICEYLYKLALEFSQEQLDQAEATYIEVENEVRLATPCSTFVDEVRKNLETFYEFPTDFATILADSRPRVGPGTFAGSGKIGSDWFLYKRSERFTRSILRRHEAISGYFKPYPDAPLRLSKVDSDTSCVSEVLFVPKDSRGPRVISREPLYRLCLQMAYFDWFSRHLERVTRYRVNFQDQRVNRSLAELGSLDGSYATFDLKEASDRVKGTMVDALFRNIPSVRFFLKDRTRFAKLPSGRIIPLAKLAGMGSGLTFATMACIIHAAIATEISSREKVHFRHAMNCVYVYGDDVIVPKEYSHHVIPALEKVALKVNSEKSFFRSRLGHFRGFFRESCGGDYFGGNSVTPVRLRLANAKPVVRGTNLVLQRTEGLIQMDRHARELYNNSLHSAAAYIWNCIERYVGKLPAVGVDSPAIGRVVKDAIDLYRADETGTYQTVKCLVPVPCTIEYDEDPYLYLSRYLKRKGEPSDIESTYGLVSIPRQVRLRSRRLSALQIAY